MLHPCGPGFLLLNLPFLYDYDVWLEKLAPHEPVSRYRHNVSEDNADVHMKRQIIGREVVVAVTDGKARKKWGQI